MSISKAISVKQTVKILSNIHFEKWRNGRIIAWSYY